MMWTVSFYFPDFHEKRSFHQNNNLLEGEEISQKVSVHFQKLAFKCPSYEIENVRS